MQKIFEKVVTALKILNETKIPSWNLRFVMREILPGNPCVSEGSELQF